MHASAREQRTIRSCRSEGINQDAAQKDMAAVRQGLIDSGQSPQDVDAALAKVDQRNRDNGVYDPETLVKLTR